MTESSRSISPVQSAAPRNGRWQARYDDISRAVKSAREKIDAEQGAADRSPPADEASPGAQRFGPPPGEAEGEDEICCSTAATSNSARSHGCGDTTSNARR
jgi:hypothetical protein